MEFIKVWEKKMTLKGLCVKSKRQKFLVVKLKNKIKYFIQKKY